MITYDTRLSLWWMTILILRKHLQSSELVRPLMIHICFASEFIIVIFSLRQKREFYSFTQLVIDGIKDIFPQVNSKGFTEKYFDYIFSGKSVSYFKGNHISKLLFLFWAPIDSYREWIKKCVAWFNLRFEITTISMVDWCVSNRLPDGIKGHIFSSSVILVFCTLRGLKARTRWGKWGVEDMEFKETLGQVLLQHTESFQSTLAKRICTLKYCLCNCWSSYYLCWRMVTPKKAENKDLQTTLNKIIGPRWNTVHLQTQGHWDRPSLRKAKGDEAKIREHKMFTTREDDMRADVGLWEIPVQ